MEKALDTPSNVMIYKQHWDYYARTPGLLDKLKTDQPVQHHLLQHFRQNFWHLVENLETLLVFQDVQTATVEVHSLLLLDSGRGGTSRTRKAMSCSATGKCWCCCSGRRVRWRAATLQNSSCGTDRVTSRWRDPDQQPPGQRERERRLTWRPR